jgi:hypothetical protein
MINRDCRRPDPVYTLPPSITAKYFELELGLNIAVSAIPSSRIPYAAPNAIDVAQPLFHLRELP